MSTDPYEVGYGGCIDELEADSPERAVDFFIERHQRKAWLQRLISLNVAQRRLSAQVKNLRTREHNRVPVRIWVEKLAWEVGT